MTLPMTINDPAVIAELRQLYPRYEQALVDNNVEKLVEMFWAGPQVMRFGATENLYGPEELAAFRKARPAANLARTITRLDIVSFGHDFASITLEFERFTRSDPPRRIQGRQSQVWVRLPEGWRIVQAHVSVLQAP
jgi:AtzH-like